MKVLAFLAALLAASAAQSASITCQSILNGFAPAGCAATVTTGSTTILVAAVDPSTRSALVIANQAASGGNAISCTFDGSTAALNTAGSWQIPAATQLAFTGYGQVPSGAVNCIAATGSTAATIYSQ